MVGNLESGVDPLPRDNTQRTPPPLLSWCGVERDIKRFEGERRIREGSANFRRRIVAAGVEDEGVTISSYF